MTTDGPHVMPHDGANHRQFWESLSAIDPLWAILSDPTRRGRRWDVESFFRTGEREISTLLHQLSRLPGGEPPSRDSALDFGCGVGRLTQALARHFNSVVGVDVSTGMLAHAARLNQHGGRVSYVHNDHPNLHALGDRRFDLVYTDLVLQHLPPGDALGYVDEFVRLLKPGGVLVFQLPSHRRAELPPEVIPMPDASYRARLEIEDVGAAWPQGIVRIRVRVTNMSDATWDQAVHGAIRVGNHWLSAGGDMLVQDDARAWLPEVMAPAQEVAVTLDVSVPDLDRPLVLEIDAVHEGHSWFADQGSPTARVAVRTEDDSGARRASAQANTPVVARGDELLMPHLSIEPVPDVQFPMYGVERGELVRFVTARGCRLLAAEDDGRGGREWVGFRYFFRKG